MTLPIESETDLHTAPEEMLFSDMLVHQTERKEIELASKRLYGLVESVMKREPLPTYFCAIIALWVEDEPVFFFTQYNLLRRSEQNQLSKDLVVKASDTTRMSGLDVIRYIFRESEIDPNLTMVFEHDALLGFNHNYPGIEFGTQSETKLSMHIRRVNIDFSVDRQHPRKLMGPQRIPIFLDKPIRANELETNRSIGTR